MIAVKHLEWPVAELRDARCFLAPPLLAQQISEGPNLRCAATQQQPLELQSGVLAHQHNRLQTRKEPQLLAKMLGAVMILV